MTNEAKVIYSAASRLNRIGAMSDLIAMLPWMVVLVAAAAAVTSLKH